MEPITISLSSLKAFGIVMTLIQLFFLFTFVVIAATMIILALPKVEKKLENKLKLDTFKSSDQSVELPQTSQKVRTGQAVIAVLLLIYMSTFLMSQLFHFHHVNVLADGTWKLKNRWGITVGTIAPDVKRMVDINQITTTFTNVTYSKVTNDVVVIATDKKVYWSLEDTHDHIKVVKNQLLAQAQKQQVETNIEYTLHIVAQYIRYIVLGLGVIAGWWFWRK